MLLADLFIGLSVYTLMTNNVSKLKSKEETGGKPFTHGVSVDIAQFVTDATNTKSS